MIIDLCSCGALIFSWPLKLTSLKILVSLMPFLLTTNIYFLRIILINEPHILYSTYKVYYFTHYYYQEHS